MSPHEYELTLPSTVAQERKNTPVFTGLLKYFPNALEEVAKVSKIGNDQHNPNTPIHWDRNKSTDQLDAGTRHLIDHAKGIVIDTDGGYHLAKSIWRLCAELEIILENKSK